MLINENFFKIKNKYLFSNILQIVKGKKKQEEDIEFIDLSIGDVKLPLNKKVVNELHRAVDDMGDEENFKGYSPEQGYEFLRNEIAEKYKGQGVTLNLEDIFVNDGSKSDLGNITDIFSRENIIGLQSVVYPVYLDVCKMGGFEYTCIKSYEKNNFLPMPKDIVGDIPTIIYLCSPNNPTGMAYNKEQLEKWVKYALNNGIVIIFDAAYKTFINESDIPHTIYQIDGAKNCAIEICSFSKSAGFTGLRCGYTIIPSAIRVRSLFCDKHISLNSLWQRRQATKFNGVSYLTQKAATKVLEENLYENVAYYRNNAKLLTEAFSNLNFKYWGGVNSPYIWLKCPPAFDSMEYFYFLLNRFKVVVTPGIGFGREGKNFVRISVLNKLEEITKCIEKFNNYYR